MRNVLGFIARALKTSPSRRGAGRGVTYSSGLSRLYVAMEESLEDRLLLATQMISSDAPAISVSAGDTFTVIVNYQTFNDNGAAAALRANRIDFNLHFDNAQLEFLSSSQIFQEGLSVTPNATGPDSANKDGDPTTDFVLRARYEDAAGGIPGWPDAFDDFGKTLYVATFRARPGFTATTINFSANETGAIVGQAGNFRFDQSSLIVESPSGPTLSIRDSPVAVEGTSLAFVIDLNVASTETITVNFSTEDGNGPSGAIAGEDYVAIANQQITFNPGETQKTVLVSTIDDSIADPDETMTGVLSSPVGAGIGRKDGVGPIQDNDVSQVSLSVSDAPSVGEGGTAIFTVFLSAASDNPVTVQFSTVDGEGPISAVSGDDFVAQTNQTLTFNPGETEKKVLVATVDDSIVEEQEEFLLRIFNSNGASISDSEGLGLINDNDGGLVQASINDAAPVTEGGNAVFTVTLNAAATLTVTVTYSTSTGSGPTGATDGVDYTAHSNQQVTFNPGQTSKTITVATIDDSISEPTETFVVTLSNAANASIAQSQGVGTIIDNDTAQRAVGNVDGDSDFDANDSFLIQLVKLSGTDTQITQSKGSSSLTAAQIRANVNALGPNADVDGDQDFDANDAFLAHLIKLSGTDIQINQSKGASTLTAAMIRANVNALGTASSSSSSSRVISSRVAKSPSVAVAPSSIPKESGLFAATDEPAVLLVPSEENPGDSSDAMWEGYRDWLDAI